MAVNVLNDRIELASIFADVSALGGESQSYADNFYNLNSSLTFNIPSQYIENPVLTDVTNNLIFVEGVNQQTEKRYLESYNTDENTNYGSTWDEGYYKIYVRQYVKPSNGTNSTNAVQGGDFYELSNNLLYWNKSQISFMTFIQPGKFWMGSPVGEIGRQTNESLHYVTISNAFYIARTQMTTNLFNKILSGSDFGPVDEYYSNGTGSTELRTFMSGTTELNTCFASGNTPGWYGISDLNNIPRRYFSYSKYNRYPSSPLRGTRGGGSSLNGFIKVGTIGYPPPYITGSYMGEETDRSLLRAMEIKIPFTHSNGTVYHWDLPTEAQWEYTCRAGTKSAFNNGENLKFKTSRETGGSDSTPQPNIDDVCWYSLHNNAIHFVATLNPNKWGLFDCHGNAQEYCKDWYAADNTSLTNGDYEFTGYPSNVSIHVVRGGYYNIGAYVCRSAYRGYQTPSYAYRNYSFRPVLHI